MQGVNKLILGSVLSEKSVKSSEANQYVLKVDLKATKPEIAAALKEVFGVNCKSVRTLVVRGAAKRKLRSKRGGYVQTKKANFKKAVVSLAAGESLPFVGAAKE
jgi:large subunit ribosomal protein L23